MCDVISHGQYLILQKKNYKKLHLLSQKTECVFMGKDKVELEGMVGKHVGSTFKMVPKRGQNRHFTLQLCTKSDIHSVKESIRDLGSGADNRTICDDGSSQLLTSSSIEKLRDKGSTPQSILEHLVENSKTFQIKTEYSQEKYIEKKEKKYCEFITVKQPTIRVLAEIFYSRDLPKSVGIRVDTLSQLITSLSFHPMGSYILVESGFRGMVAANLLNSLSDEGKLVLITPDNQNQKQAVLAMNFSSTRLSQLFTIRLSTLVQMVEGNSILPNSTNAVKESGNNALIEENTLENLTSCHKENEKCASSSNGAQNSCSNDDVVSNEVLKRKISNVDFHDFSSEPKKPRWATEAESAVKIILEKVDGLMIACKELPSNILCKLFGYLLPSRPFVVYSLHQEPLVSLYLLLKQRKDVIYLRITETWYRPYQILPDRSHPVVTMSSSSGYLLSGIKLAT